MCGFKILPKGAQLLRPKEALDPSHKWFTSLDSVPPHESCVYVVDPTYNICNQDQKAKTFSFNLY